MSIPKPISRARRSGRGTLLPLLAGVALAGCDALTGPASGPEYELVVGRLVAHPEGYGYAADLFRIDPFAPGVGVNLTNTPDFEEEDPAWSPDGTRIAHTRRDRRFANAQNVWVMRPDGTGARAMTSVDASYGPRYPAWSPDGSRLAYVENDDLYVADRDGSSPTRLYLWMRDVGALDWSPDGTRILFHAGYEQPGLYTVRPDGTDLAAVHSPWRYAGDPAWSPDGRRIAYVGVDVARDDLAVFLANADGSAPVRLTPSDGRYPLAPTWSPDGRWIAYGAWADGSGVTEGMIVRTDGSGTPRSLGEVTLSRLAWRP